MSVWTAPGPETLAGLQAEVKAVAPDATLVPRRILRRAIRHLVSQGTLGWHLPHRDCVVLDAGTALQILERDEIGLEPHETPPPHILLIAAPSNEEITESYSGILRLRIWQSLFHGRILTRFAELNLSRAAARSRIDRLGHAEFDEIRSVLRFEDCLIPPVDERTEYREFVALYWQLAFFDPRLLPLYFPSLVDRPGVEQLLSRDFKPRVLYESCRIRGSLEPPLASYWLDPVQGNGPGAPNTSPSLDAEVESVTELHPRSKRSIARSMKAERLGNHVRAAIWRVRAGEDATELISSLTDRLQAALRFPDEELRDWRQFCLDLLPNAALGIWPVEARVLYDLQKLCIDHERQVYRLDSLRWLLTLGRSPLRRPLPLLKWVHIPKRLRAALRRLRFARIERSLVERYQGLVRHALHLAESESRDQFRAGVSDAIRSTGMIPRNVPEEVASRKLVEELLDQIVERGFMTMSHLRDAVSRNQLKLPDLDAWRELQHGDRLLKSDRVMSAVLPGIYHPGEIYLRLLQLMSATIFGTRLGRWLTRYVALPFGGAYVILEGLQHTLVHVIDWFFDIHPHIAGLAQTLPLGVMLLGLLHHAEFRRAWLQTIGVIGHWLRAACITLPRTVFQLEWLRAILQSRVTRVVWKVALKPLLATIVILAMMRVPVLQNRAGWLGPSLLFASLTVVLNTRFGRDFEEVFTDAMIQAWNRVRADWIPGLFRLIVDLFQRALEEFERLLYTVDEWLRFRSGEGRLALILKATFGSIWRVLEYVVRFYITLLVEPQLNPIKHFPVVTVSHKVMLPFSLTITKVFAAPLLPLGEVVAYAVAGGTVFLLPGIFGFLVWELKENWKLYESNRAAILQPVTVGSHGETMSRFLRPGLHSGTLPKQFARWRRLERNPSTAGTPRCDRPRDAIHHVEHEVRSFVEREWLSLLEVARFPATLRVTSISAASNRILVEIIRDDVAGAESQESSLRIVLEEQSGLLLATVINVGWVDDLDQAARQTLSLSLLGFYHLCGVDLTREQIIANFSPREVFFDITDQGLVVFPDRAFELQIVYDLTQEPVIEPMTPAGAVTSGFPVLMTDQVLFRRKEITWSTWVERWDSVATAAESVVQPEEESRLLPPPKSIVGLRAGTVNPAAGGNARSV